MKVVGIIAEYNPFHNGHAYQIRQIRENLNADYVIVVMSGNFVQRGTPAITDKYTRTAMALSGGADVVFELPCLWATSSAECFAKAGVTLLENAGVVDTLCFGAESDDITSLNAIATELSKESKDFVQALSQYLTQGNSYPVARANALKDALKISNLDEILNHPNNILGIEYLKALQSSSIQPYIIRREGDKYHAKTIESSFASASALREKIYQKDLFMLHEYIPQESYEVFEKIIKTQQFLMDDDISDVVGYALLRNSGHYEDFADCSRELADKIKNQLPDYESFHSFCESLKTKEITYTRISRTLLHIALNHTKQDYEIFKGIGYVPYLRLLGFKKDSSEILSAIKAGARVPIISKLADASNYLEEPALRLLEADIYASNLYNQMMRTRKHHHLPNDYRQHIIIQ